MLTKIKNFIKKTWAFIVAGIGGLLFLLIPFIKYKEESNLKELKKNKKTRKKQKEKIDDKVKSIYKKHNDTNTAINNEFKDFFD